jgi:uncharacterized membrane protein YtjA (UPF0391 family)
VARAQSGRQAGTLNAACSHNHQEACMFKWAIIFAVIAVVAGVFGFTGIAAGSAAIAKFLFVAALIIFLVFLVLGIAAAKKIT